MTVIPTDVGLTGVFLTQLLQHPDIGSQVDQDKIDDSASNNKNNISSRLIKVNLFSEKFVT